MVKGMMRLLKSGLVFRKPKGDLLGWLRRGGLASREY